MVVGVANGVSGGGMVVIKVGITVGIDVSVGRIDLLGVLVGVGWRGIGSAVPTQAVINKTAKIIMGRLVWRINLNRVFFRLLIIFCELGIHDIFIINLLSFSPLTLNFTCQSSPVFLHNVLGA